MSRRRTKGVLSSVDQEADRELRYHLQTLGVENVEEYRNWCRQHGFSRRLDKGGPQRQRERLVATREVATARLAEYKKKAKFPDAIIDIFSGRLRRIESRSPSLAAIQRASEATSKDRRVRANLLSLLLHVQPITNFLDATPALPQFGPQAGNTWIDALTALALHWRAWLRPVEEWQPRTHNTRRQFASLARHLLAEYPVPSFMDSVWFMGTGSAADCRQRWFSHIGRGKNLRTADVPLPLTKRMAHYVMQAPNHFNVDQALRWGQVRGLGGSSRLAEALAATRLGDHFENNEFWATVIGFFIDNPLLDLVHVGPIIDYLQHQRFEHREEFQAAGVFVRRPPPQPNLTMKGRNPETLLRQVERWHRQLAHESVDLKAQWPGAGIKGFDCIEGREGTPSLRRWTIRELLSSRALVAEGRAMHHCVASYAGSCSRRVTSIWSLQMHNHEGSQRILTVEVRLPQKIICQARGKRNVLPDAKPKDILRRWAAQEGLRLAIPM
jgi:hypothetical protein